MARKKKSNDSALMIRSAAASVGSFTVKDIAERSGIDRTTLTRRLEHFNTFTVGELAALMKLCPTITDEDMGRAIRDAAR